MQSQCAKVTPFAGPLWRTLEMTAKRTFDLLASIGLAFSEATALAAVPAAAAAGAARAARVLPGLREALSAPPVLVRLEALLRLALVAATAPVAAAVEVKGNGSGGTTR